MALLILLARTARTRIIAADLLRLYDRSGFPLLEEELMLLLFGEYLIPGRKPIQPVCPRIDHVLIEKLLIKPEVHFGILCHRLDRILLHKAVIDPVQEPDHGLYIDSILKSEFTDGPLNDFVGIFILTYEEVP